MIPAAKNTNATNAGGINAGATNWYAEFDTTVHEIRQEANANFRTRDTVREASQGTGS